jgi:hypothetical protein
VPTSNLYHIKVPSKYVDKKYFHLFDALTTRMFMIPMGLYRKTRVNLRAYKETPLNKGVDSSKSAQGEKKEPKWKEIKYVVTNPHRNTVLNADDLVFVLAKSDPGDPDTWDNYTEKNKDMFDQNQNKLMQDINEMMYKQKGFTKKKPQAGENINGANKGSATGADANAEGNQRNSMYVSGQNQQLSNVQKDDLEQQEIKPDIH